MPRSPSGSSGGFPGSVALTTASPRLPSSPPKKGDGGALVLGRVRDNLQRSLALLNEGLE